MDIKERKINLFSTSITKQAIAFSKDVLYSGFVNDGDWVSKFQEELESLGIAYPVCVNSGTSALHLATVLAGVNEDSTVITSAQTFIASSLAILYAKGKPVFADINPFTGNLIPESVESKITEKTKAILAVDWGGYPSDLLELSEIAKKYNLKLIEDAAHSFGATYRGFPVGYGQVDYCCFSTQAIKSLTTVEGGILCCKSEQDTQRANKLKWFGVDKKKSPEGELGEREYVLDEVGFKMNFNNLFAAIGLGNLVGFPERLARRRAIAKRYFTELQNVAGLELMRYQDDRESSYWLFPILVENRLAFVRKMKEKGIPVSVVHQRIDRHPIFAQTREQMESLTGMDYFNEHQIHIPVHNGLTDEDVSLVVETIRGGW